MLANACLVWGIQACNFDWLKWGLLFKEIKSAIAQMNILYRNKLVFLPFSYKMQHWFASNLKLITNMTIAYNKS